MLGSPLEAENGGMVVPFGLHAVKSFVVLF